MRARSAEWLDYFKDGRAVPAYVARLDAVRDLLQAMAATSFRAPWPGFGRARRMACPSPASATKRRCASLAGALDKGPLPPAVMAEIERVIVREPEGEPRDR